MRVVILATVLAVAFSVDAKTSVETRENVCLNQEDGTFVADSDLCSGFFVCHNGQAVSQNCDPGSYFDKKQLYCLPDTRNICNPSECEEDGAYSTHSTNCSLFNVCNGGKLVVQSCGEGSYFDSKDLFCKPDVDHTCWPEREPCTCVGNYTEGELVKDPDSCHSYYICSKGNLVQQTCGYGNYFDDSTKRCARDNIGECWNQTHLPCAGGIAEGDRVSKNCSAYLECKQGELIEYNCKYEYIFDNSTKQCVRDEEGKCWEKCPLCPGGYKQGDLVGPGANCSSYFRCDNGKLIPDDCGLGNYFDNMTMNCVRDVNGICCPPCPGGYKDGEFVANKDSCYAYDVCINGKLVTQSCGTGNYFDKDRKVCDRDYEGKCWPSKCNEGEKLPDETSCHGYFVCNNGKLVAKDCGNGYLFDSQSKKCVRDDKYICWPRPPCAGGLQEGDRVPSSKNCSLYLQCTQGDLVEHNCGYNYFFDSSKKQCVRDNDGECWPQCNEGEQVPDKTSCHGYFVCDNGKLVAKDCGNGYLFDSLSKKCVRDDKYICWPRPPCPGGLQEGDRVSSSKNCSVYLECSQGQLVEHNCGYEYLFDNSTKQCVRDEDGKCWDICPPCPGGYEQGDLVGNSANCSSYLICDGGKLIPGDCGPGNYFDNSSKNCVRDNEGKCWPQCNEGDKVPDKTSCHGYFVCNNGKLVAKDCGNGYLFDSQSKKCVRDDKYICWPRPPCPGGLEEGDRVPSSKNCSLYLQCTQGDLVEHNCGYNYFFDSSKKQCVRDNDGKCWPQCNEGEQVPDKTSCHGYFVCDNGKLVAKDCGNGYLFDSQSKKCVRDDKYICWPRPPCPGGLQEGDRVSSSKNCSVYLECSQGQLVEHNCGYEYLFDNSTKQCVRDEDGKCWDICPPCPGGYEQGDLVGNSANCSSYLICDGGKLIPGDCGPGNYFDNSSKNCVRDNEGKCWPQCNEGDKVPDKTSCHGYFVCNNGKLVAKDCGNGYLFDSQSKKCVRDDKYICWPRPPCPGGLQEGDRVPSSKNCSLYLQCTQGDLVEHNCGYNYFFDSSKKQCVRDNEGECWPQCNEGEQVPDKTSCHGYFVCNNGKLVAKDCGNGYLFDSQSKKCVRDDKYICWPRPPCPGGLQEGDRVPSSKNCSLYLQCTQGDLVEHNCGYNYFFDKSTKQCVRDNDGECWPQCNEGEQVPDKTSCHGYFVCNNGKLVAKDCGNGYLFDSQSKKCVHDDKFICWPRPPCPGGLQEGDRVSSSKNCSVYLECSQGQLVEHNCGYEYLFDNSTKQCVRDEDGKCWDICPPCPGGYEQGDLVGNSANCSSYLICDGGKLIPGDCGPGNYFDNSSKNCVRDNEGKCWPQCNEGDKVPDKTSCHGYFVCNNGKLVAKDCGNGYLFDSQSKKCVRDDKYICWPRPPCPGGLEEGDRVPSSKNCSLYLQCTQGDLVEHNCGYNYFFDSSTKQCVRDNDGKCWPQCNEGDKVPDKTSCHGYFVCNNGKLVAKDCGNGYLFDSQSKKCVRDDKYICWPRPICPGGLQEGDRVPSSKNCSLYLQCTQGDLVEHNCGYNYFFDSSTKQCVRDNDGKCWPQCNEGDKVPDKTSCHGYFVCNNGKLVAKDCGKGYLFDSQSKKCVRDDKYICWPRPPCPGGLEEGDRVPSSKNCSLYLQCTQGDLVEHNCGYNYFFDSSTKQCVRDNDGKCWPQCNEGEQVPDKTSCHGYFVCNNGKLVAKDCGNGYLFDSQSKKCVRDDNYICWPRPPCPGGLEEGDRVPSSKNCSVYLQCIQGNLVERDCGYKYLFDNSKKQCVSDTNGVCWKDECECEGGYKDGDFVPNEDSCFSYYVCTKGNLIAQSCGAGNYFDKDKKVCVRDNEGICWPKCNEGEKVPDKTSCHGYFICNNGKLVAKDCGNGYLFDSQSKTCVRDDKYICWPRPPCPGGLKEGDRVPSSKNCSLYLQCTQGDLVEHNCGYNYFFDNSTKQCVRDNDGKCWPQCNEGDKVPDKTSCHGYFVCSNGKLVAKNCGNGYLFDSQSKKCVRDDKYICWPRPPCPGGLKEGDRVPSSKNCSLYLQCTQGDLVEHNCGYNYFFDNSTKQCVRDNDGKCWPQCNEGDKVPDKTSCHGYFVCNNGKLVAKDCGNGYLFDSQSKKCVRDDKYICWPRPPCPGGLGEGDRVSSSKNCSLYLECTQGELVEHNCGYKYLFDSSTKQCVRDEDGKCWDICPPCPGGYEQGDIVGSSVNCSSFFICYGGKLVPGDCGLGNYFDTNTKSCVRDNEGKCWPQCNEGEKVPDKTSCHGYFICNSGKLVAKDCGNGYLFDSQSKKCVRDDKYICWPRPPCPGGLKEGDRVSSSKNCSVYLQCTEGDLVEHNCGYNYLFDNSTKQCVRDNDGKCWPQCNEGEKVPDKASCHGYFICNNGKLVAKDCGNGYLFDSQSKKCVRDDKYICWPRPPCPGGLKEGDRVSSSKNCSLYLQCTEGDLVEHNCGYNYLFDNSTKQCVRDNDGKCWPQCNEGEQVPDKTSCHGYFVCNNGKLVAKDCGNGFLFDIQSKKCVRDDKYICWPRPPCPGGLEEGDRVPSSKNCSLYLQCTQGDLVEHNCGYNYFFDSSTKQCVRDNDGKCWPQCNEGEQVPDKTSCHGYFVCNNGKLVAKDCGNGFLFDIQSKKCMRDDKYICWPRPPCPGGVKEGDRVPSSKNCSLYLQCTQGNLVEHNCGYNYFFDSSTKQCVRDNDGKCWPQCNEGEQVPDKTSCHGYFVCNNGKLVAKDCGNGYLFDSQSKKCVRDDKYICWPRPPCPGGVKEGDRVPSSKNCSLYLQCTQGDLVEHNCGYNYFFDSSTKQCVRDNDGKCWPQCNEGEQVPDKTSCHGYFVCNNGKLVAKDCGNGYLFDSQSKKCVRDDKYICWPRPPCPGGVKEGDRVSSSKNCSLYLQCTEGDLVEHNCGYKYLFDNSTKQCVPDTNEVCWKETSCDCEGGIKDGEFVPNKDSCYAYYVCTNRQLVPQSCGTGNYFDKDKKVCVRDSDGKCWPQCNEGEKVPDKTSCHGYFVCNSGKLVAKDCGNGYLFDSQIKKCVRDDKYICWPRPPCPGGVKEGDRVSSSKNCSLYLQCTEGDLVEHNCGYNYLFDNSTKQCVRDNDGKCWPQCNEGEKVPDNTSCHGYFVCNSGKLVAKDCGNGYLFDSQSKKCVRDDNYICWPRPQCPGDLKEGDRVSSSKNCSLYLQCTEGDLVEHNCGYKYLFDNSTKQCVPDTNEVCWKETPCDCEGGIKDGEFVPNKDSCYAYYVCTNRQLVPQSCGIGNYFDKDKKVCVRDSDGKCWPQCNEGEKVPDKTSCHGYFVCNSGKLVAKDCGNGYLFDSQSKKCVRDDKYICWPRPSCPGDLEEGDRVSSSKNCSLYLQCTEGDLVEHNCGYKYLFDNSTKQCVPDTNEVCWKETSCDCEGGIKDGEFVPNKDSCYAYYVCTNRQLVPQSCGTGNYFDKDKKVCVRDSDGKCWPQCNEGEKVPDKTSCHGYFVCNSGKLVAKDCGNGYLFDSQSKKCVRDDKYICWPRPSCPGDLEEGDRVSSSKNCSLYLQCTEGDLVEHNCGYKYLFDNSTKQCVPDTNEVCWKETPCDCEGGIKDGEFVPNKDSCYAYYVCTNRQLVPQSCGTGNYFDKDKKVCVRDSDGKCWPQCNEGEKVPDKTSCHGYFICNSGKLVAKDCGNGYLFDSQSKKCVRDDKYICWPRPSCSGDLEEGDRVSSSKNCSLYLQCTQGDLVEHNCGYNYLFDNSTKQCVRDNDGKCWPQCNEGEKVPDKTSCHGYFICNEGKLEHKSCAYGDLFDSQSKKCVRDDKYICWPRPSCPGDLEEGDRVSSSKNCSLYLQCTEGKLVEHNCGYEYLFDNSTKQCVRDKDGKCWDICPPCLGDYKQGDLVGNSANCSSYFICYDGQLIPGDCGPGIYFDNTTKSCVRDNEGKCWPSKCKEGEKLPDKTSCHNYFVCNSGELEHKSCADGDLFDSQSKKCVRDDKYICWPRPLCPGDLEEGDRIPSPKNCSVYLECTEGILVEHNCEYEYLFDNTTEKCVRDEDGKCWGKKCPLCPGGYEQGDLVGPTTNCSSYFHCDEGKLIPADCGFGNYFDNTTANCVRDKEGICWKDDKPCVCPKGMKEGERVDNPEFCYMYFVCSQGNLVAGNCGTANYFNNETKTCDRDENNCCWPCVNGEMIPNIEECDKFSICNDGKFMEQQCGTGYYFDVYEKYCLRDVNGTCWKVQPPSNTCQGAKDGTLLPDPTACEKYFDCQNNKPVAKECGIGNLFNTTTLSCVHDTCGECWTKIPNACANQSTGTFLADADHCDQFLVCNENRAILQHCGSGNWFNPKSKLCEQDLYAKCINVCQNTKGTIQLPHPNCNQFYLCTNGLTKAVRTCLKGTNYDAILGICLASATCEENLCSTSPNGVSFPVRNDPSSFYTCYNKKPVKLSCPGGTTFDSERLLCIPDAGLCMGQVNGFTTASKKNPNAYYVCKDNAAIFEQCPPQTVFDENKSICVHALRKRVVNNICSSETDGTMLSTNVCNKFHLCLDGESIEQNCGAYASFNPKLGSCVFNATCFNPKNICGKSSDIEKFPDSRDETSFIACKRGLATMEKCPKNTIYSQDIGACVSKQMTITKKELSEICSKVSDKTITPALDCRKFYICSNRVAVLQQCAIDQMFNLTTGTCQADTKRQCWMRSETLRKSNFLRTIDDSDDYKIICQDCQKRHEPKIHPKAIKLFNKHSIFLIRSPRSIGCSSDYKKTRVHQSEKSCNEFYKCENDQWILKKCPWGKFFNIHLETCTKNNSSCGINQQIEAFENNSCMSNEIKPNEMNCGSYYVCFEKEWWHRHCEEGFYFNKTQGRCINADGSCKSISKHNSPCKNGTILKTYTENSCSSYYLCINDSWSLEKCSNGHYFNDTLRACMQDDIGACANGIKHQYVESNRKFNPSNCTAFKIFHNNEWLSVNCPASFYFDILTEKCLLSNGECSVDGLLRRNCIEKTLQPSFNNHSEFYQCYNNQWHLESCMENFQFNATLQKCVVSTNNTNDLIHFSKSNNLTCAYQQSGFFYSHGSDCTKFYYCDDGIWVEGVCNRGAFFDRKNQICQDDNKVCGDKLMTHDSICQNKLNGSFHKNPANCSTFYACIDNVALLTACAQGKYFDAELGYCQADIRKCIEKHHCNETTQIQLPHEKYCSIYYTCVSGKLIPIACEETYYFDSVLNKCVPDIEHLCIDGLFKTKNTTVDVTVADLSMSCIGRQGDIMPDQKNCNKFYVCINEQLRHEKCFDGEFFDNIQNSCISKTSNDTENCQNSSETTMMCSIGDSEINYADHTDCRKYYQCNDAELVSKKCRNGESFDNLLGFCRQNDGTCLIENGQRVGACAGKHGKLIADVDNCLQYFACINGQKILKSCKIGEHFDKTTSQCEKDLNRTCSAFEDQLKNIVELNCDGLEELFFYPNILDDCKSFFQCVNSTPKVHSCPHDFLFDIQAGVCDCKENVNCSNNSNHQ